MAICRLLLRDFVIVQSLELELAGGFTALTGETGAGKSILIDAIQIALGERASATIVREGATKADIAIEFDHTPNTRAWLEETGFDCQDTLLIRRTIDTEGRSRAWINGSAATATQIRELAPHLVDIHGQHAWAMLTRPDAIRDLLDAYAQIDRTAFQGAWDAWRNSHIRLEQTKNQLDTQTTQRERLEWQINEVEKLAIHQNEWHELNSEHSKLSHAQTLIDAAAHALNWLSGTDTDNKDHAAGRIQSALQAVQAQCHIEQDFQAICDELHSAHAQVQDAARSLQNYLHHTELDPTRLAQLDRRLVDWLSLARRLKCPPDELYQQLEQWRTALHQINTTSDITALEQQERQHHAALMALAQALSQKRAQAAPQLAQAITQAMQHLGMKGGQFEVALHTLDAPTRHGMETVEFLVAGHAGSTPKPITKIASGGELSRIALAIAVTTSKLGDAPTLIFDEVDSGIGGATAQTVGQLMKQLGADRQVLAVTHLPQVACCAHQHGVISKNLAPKDAIPSSQITFVAQQARVAEIARMLGGEPLTQAALTHACTMLDAS